MVKTGRWLRSFFLAAKKGQGDGEKKQQQQLPTGPPNSKKRWSFRRSTKDPRSTDTKPSPANHDVVHTQSSGSADAADLAPTRTRVEEEVAAVKIQASYRAYLARKALKALKGLVKLQALIRGHLVRKQTTSMLRCMQALVAAQTRARIQRMQFLEKAPVNSHRQLAQRRSPSPQQRGDPLTEDKMRDVEIDLGDCRNSYPSLRMEREEQRLGPRYRNPPIPQKSEELQQHSPAISGITETTPRTCSGHFDELSFKTALSSPNHLSAISKLRYIKDYALLLQQQDAVSVSKSCDMFYPNYMANTESSRAKARSQSAPRRRSDARRPPLYHRSSPRGVTMHRSSSGVGLSGNGSVKFDVSDVSIQESECGSSSSFLSNANNWRL